MRKFNDKRQYIGKNYQKVKKKKIPSTQTVIEELLDVKYYDNEYVNEDVLASNIMTMNTV